MEAIEHVFEDLNYPWAGANRESPVESGHTIYLESNPTVNQRRNREADSAHTSKIGWEGRLSLREL